MNKKAKKLYATAALTISIGASVLSGCGKKKNKVTTIETPSITIEVPTVTIETPTNTPTPTEAPTPTLSPTPAPSERKISAQDIKSANFDSNDYFGPKEDYETEVEKRKEYLESFEVLNNNEMDAVINYVNGNESAENMNALPKAIDKIVDHNKQNQDDIIPLSILGTDLTENEITAYNGIQESCIRMFNILPNNASADECRANNSWYMISDLINPSKLTIKADVVIDGVKQTIIIPKDSLSPMDKYLIALYGLKALEDYKSSPFLYAVYYGTQDYINEGKWNTDTNQKT